MRLDEAARATQALKETNHSVLFYGPPKTGKTRLVATAAKLPEVKKIYWVDIENGSDTILNMGLTEEELKKFIIFKIPDTRDEPRAIETVLKMVTSKEPLKVCDTHGIVDCAVCAKIEGATFEEFYMRDTKHNELFVLDSGSQLGVSALNASCKGKGASYKPQFDDWGNVGKWLSDFLLVVQQAQFTNMIVITHELLTEGEDKVERIYPLMGTKAFSANVGRYFGTVVYTHFKLGKHAAGSSSTFKSSLITGSRVNVAMEKSVEPSMRDILIGGGILKAGS